MSGTRDSLAGGVLAINARSEEVLHGLTLKESQFLMDLGDGSLSDRTARDGQGGLTLQHEHAWLRIATADDESSSN
ncbi:hypothetical protein [Variovorax sp. RCC_210]|uniref:hypothetical protein n=1 Tax=Variovorax sp. RCC_210 TaxID=3239217 RepID=UPI003523FE0E